MSFSCKFCKKNYSTKSSLNNHQKTVKACILIQKKSEDNSIKHTQYECKDCKAIFILESSLNRHINKCIAKKNSDALQEKIYIKKIKEELKTLNDRCKKQECELESYKKQNTNNINLLKKQELYYTKRLKEKDEEKYK